MSKLPQGRCPKCMDDRWVGFGGTIPPEYWACKCCKYVWKPRSKLLCRWGAHSMTVVSDNGKTIYEKCRRDNCDHRSVHQRRGGHQPIDSGWVKTGEWTKHGPPPSFETGVMTPSEMRGRK